ncbi:MAG TPA: hypothetical protein VH814_20075 [Steroidobacteraceae bacterium]
MRLRVVAAIGALCLASVTFGAARAEPSAAQAARLAQLRPESVIISRSSEKVAIRGGDLGRFDPQRSPVENLHELIGHLGLLHDAARSAEFTVAEQMPRFVKFTQLIGGIPVSQRIEVELDPDGRVVEARLAVVDPARAPHAQPITRERALEIAVRACATEIGAAEAEVALRDFPGLHYQPTAMGEPLQLEYRFSGSGGPASSYIVRVDAFTGAARVELGVIA